MNLCGVGMSQGSEHLYIWYRVEDRQLKIGRAGGLGKEQAPALG